MNKTTYLFRYYVNNFIAASGYCLFNLCNHVAPCCGSCIHFVFGLWQKFLHHVVHEAYNSWTRDNDIALLLLNFPLIFTNKVRPVILPQTNQELANGLTVNVSGWGVRQVVNGTELPNVLYATSMRIVDRNTCARVYSQMLDRVTTITVNMLCADTENHSSCPVRRIFFFLDLTRFHLFTFTFWFDFRETVEVVVNEVLYGILSYGPGCGAAGPAIYTHVSRYIEWISDQN